MVGLQAELQRHSKCIADIQESMTAAGRASADLKEQFEQSRAAEELLKKLAGERCLGMLVTTPATAMTLIAVLV